jgi:hypothetical protein
MNEKRNGIIITINGPYPYSFVIQIFRSGQPSYGDDRKIFQVMNSNWPPETLGSVASLLTAILYHEKYDRNHKLWNIVSSERCVLHM